MGEKPRKITYRLLPSKTDPTLENYPFNRLQAAALQAYRAGKHVLIEGVAASGKTQLLLGVLEDYARTRSDSNQTQILPDEIVCLAPNRERSDWLNTATAVVENHYGRIWRTPVAVALKLAQDYSQARLSPYPLPFLLTGAQEETRIRRLLEQEDFTCLPQVLQESPDFVQELRNLFARCLQWGIDPQLLDHYGQQYRQEQWVEAARLFSRYQFTYQEAHLDQAAAQVRACELIEGEWENDPEITQPLPVPKIILVDDLQDLTAISAKMIRAWAARGAQVVACSNPEVAVEGYRGGEITNLDYLGRELEADRANGELDRERVELSANLLQETGQDLAGQDSIKQENERDLLADLFNAPNQSGAEKDLFSALTPRAECSSRIREVYQCRWESAYRPRLGLQESSQVLGNLQVGTLKASQMSELAARIAAIFRQAHVESSLPWEDMAVICRNQSFAYGLSKALAETDIPISALSRPGIFRTLPGCKGLIQAIGIAVYQEEYRGKGKNIAELLALKTKAITECSSEELAEYEEYTGLVKEFLNTPIVGVSIFDISRLKRIDQLERYLAVGTKHYFSYADPFLEELAEKLDRAHLLIETARKLLAESPKVALTKIWVASRQAETWQNLALNGVKAGDDYLDALLSLFAHCSTYTSQHPEQTLKDYYQLLQEQNQPEDHLAKLAQRPPGVQVITTARAAGRNWAIVVVASLETGVWPNTSVRDTTLGARILTDVHKGVLGADPGAGVTFDYLSAYRENLADEARLFHAASSRARETLILAALDDGEQAPGGFFTRAKEIFQTHPYQLKLDQHRHGSIRELVAHMRKEMLENPPDTPEYQRAKKVLLMLSLQGIESANPENWRQCADISPRYHSLARAGVSPQLAELEIGKDWYTTRENLQAEENLKLVSPSGLGTLAQCPLKWFWNRHLGFDPQAQAARLGTTVHALAETGQIDDLEQARIRICEEIGINPERANLGQSKVVEKIDKILYWLKRHLDEAPPGLSEVSAQALIGENVKITAQIDRIEYGEEEIGILDFKTGKLPSGTNTAFLSGKYQLLAYQIALEEILQKYLQNPQSSKEKDSAYLDPQLQKLISYVQKQQQENPGSSLAIPARLLYLDKDLPASNRARASYISQAALGEEEKQVVKAFLHRAAKISSKGSLCAVVSPSSCGECRFSTSCPWGKSPQIIQ